MVVILMKWWKESNTKHHQRENSENEKERENVQTHTSWCLSKGKRHRIGCRCDRKLKTEKWKPQESLFLIHSSQEKPNGDFPLKFRWRKDTCTLEQHWPEERRGGGPGGFCGQKQWQQQGVAMVVGAVIVIADGVL